MVVAAHKSGRALEPVKEVESSTMSRTIKLHICKSNVGWVAVLDSLSLAACMITCTSS